MERKPFKTLRKYTQTQAKHVKWGKTIPEWFVLELKFCQLKEFTPRNFLVCNEVIKSLNHNV